MSLADKFDHQVEPAFSHGVDLESARRQLRMSIMLVAAIGVAAFLLESSIGTQFPANQLTRSEGPGVFRTIGFNRRRLRHAWQRQGSPFKGRLPPPLNQSLPRAVEAGEMRTLSKGVDVISVPLCAASASLNSKELFLGVTPGPKHRSLLASYLLTLKRGRVAVRDMIVADLRAFVDLGAQRRAADLLIVLRLFLSKYPEAIYGCSPPTHWGTPSGVVLPFRRERVATRRND